MTLFLETEPTDDGYYWWKSDESATPVPAYFKNCAMPGETTIVVFANSFEVDSRGLFGPKIVLPVLEESKPSAWMVMCPKDYEIDFQVFTSKRDAESAACEYAESENVWQWEITPLSAGKSETVKF